jgi:ANTAR domain
VLGAIRVGVLGLYRETPGSLSPSALADVLMCADVALQLVLNSRAGADGEGDGSGRAHDGAGAGRPHDGWALDGWPDGHAEAYQATGMLSAQRGVGLEEALALLRAYAFAHDQTLNEVASAVVARQLRLDSDEAAG